MSEIIKWTGQKFYITPNCGAGIVSYCKINYGGEQKGEKMKMLSRLKEIMSVDIIGIGCPVPNQLKLCAVIICLNSACVVLI